jgi:hypothetical protein
MAKTTNERLDKIIPIPVSASLKAIVIELAAEHGTTPAQYIRWIVTNFIKSQEKHLKIEG